MQGTTPQSGVPLCVVVPADKTRRLGIVDIGRSSHQGMDAAGTGIHADVDLHAEMPLVALLGLVHLRVAPTLRVLGRGRGPDNGGIHDAPPCIIRPAASRLCLTWANIISPIPFFSNRRRNFRRVVASGPPAP